MQTTDDSGCGDVGAGISPSDPGDAGDDGRRSVGGAAGATDNQELVSAVEDLVRDLLADEGSEPATD